MKWYVCMLHEWKLASVCDVLIIQDWSICRRRNVWSLLASMFRVSVDINFRRLILQVCSHLDRKASQ